MGIASQADPPLPDWDEWQNALQPLGKPGKKLTLAVKGSARYVIVIPEQPTAQEQKAADELVQWLGQMTGAEFRVVGDEQPRQKREISVGRTNRWEEASLPGKQTDLRDEGYGIAVEKDRLFLWGGEKRGPIYAALALLEEDLGCRWYHSTGGYVIPHRPTLKFRPVPRTYAPPFLIRDPFFRDAFDGTWSLLNRTNAPHAQVPEEWGGYVDYDGMFVHTFNQMVPPGKYFDSHPEYYALINGHRSRQQLCQSHPEVIRLATESVLELARKHPNAEILEVSPNDGGQHCECPDCKALDDENGGPIGSYLTFVNRIAEAVEAKFPDLLIGSLAYLDTTDPPTRVRPRPNVAVRLCNWLQGWGASYEDWTTSENGNCVRYREALEGWSEITTHLHIWDYINNFIDYLRPVPMMHILEPAVRSYRDHGVTGVMYQSDYQGLGGVRSPMKAWVIAKLLWDPSRDVAALMADFTWGYYGEAAPALVAFDELLEEDRQEGRPFFTDERAFALIEEAERRAKDNDVLHRVKVAKLPLLKASLDRAVGHRKPGSGEPELGEYFEPGAGDRQVAVYHEWIDEFEQTAQAAGLGTWSEQAQPPPHRRVDGLILFWRELLSAFQSEVSGAEISGTWRFRTDPDEVGLAEGWSALDYDDSGWEEIGLEGGWTGQGHPRYTGYGWYRKTFSVPDNLAGAVPLKLLFGAADEDSEIWLNGEKVMDHTCVATGLSPGEIWIQPFVVDPGSGLKRKGENLLAVRVYNRLAMGGIWKPVYLFSTEEEASLHWMLDALDGKLRAREK